MFILAIGVIERLNIFTPGTLPLCSDVSFSYDAAHCPIYDGCVITAINYTSTQLQLSD